MLFNPSNFLAHIKNLITGGGMSTAGTDTPKNDAGFLVDKAFSLSDLTTDTGAATLTDSTTGAVSTTLAAVTNPDLSAWNGSVDPTAAQATAIGAAVTSLKNAVASLSAQVNFLIAENNLAASETNLRVLSLPASTTYVGSLNFVVPRDYDEATDAFFLKVIAASAGATDAPVLTATIYRKRPGSNIATVGIFTVAALSALAQALTFNVIGKGLLRDDVLTIVLTSAAHTTDAVLVYGIEPAYRSTLVSYNEVDASNNPLR